MQPYLVAHPEDEDAVRAALDAIALNPYQKGGKPRVPFKDPELPNSFVAFTADMNIAITYQVYRDQPVLGLVSIVGP